MTRAVDGGSRRGRGSVTTALARHRFASTTPSDGWASLRRGSAMRWRLPAAPDDPEDQTGRRELARPGAPQPDLGPSSRARRAGRAREHIGHIGRRASGVGDPVGQAGIAGQSAGHGGGRKSRRAIQDLASPGGTGVSAPDLRALHLTTTTCCPLHPQSCHPIPALQSAQLPTPSAVPLLSPQSCPSCLRAACRTPQPCPSTHTIGLNTWGHTIGYVMAGPA